MQPPVERPTREGGSGLRLKHRAEIQTGITLSGDGDPIDPEWPYLRVANVQTGVIDLSEVKYVRVAEPTANTAMLRPGDVLMTEGGDIDKLGRGARWSGSVTPMLHQNHVFAVRPGDKLDTKFLVYWLEASVARNYFLTTAKRSTNLASTNKSTVGNLPIPDVPIHKQRAIADFLDRDTARIDTLIEEQQRLIEMLRERRQAQISAAVLDGVLQRIPLRRLADVIDCAHVTAEFVDDDQRYPVASIRECAGAYVDLANCQYTTAEFFEQLRASGRTPRIGDLLFIRNVSVGLVSAVAPRTPDFAVGQETVLLRRRTSVDPDFLRYALTSTEVQHAIDRAMIGSTFKRINVSAIRALPLPVPSLDEQRRIAAYLDEQTSKIDTLIAETERFIELARERRSALITAAVTGQIDVTGCAG